MSAAIREWLRRLLSTFHKAPEDAEMEEELRLHVDMIADELKRRGLSFEDAARRARLQTRGIAQVMEQRRDQRGLRWLEDLIQDLHYGVRTLRRAPVFTAVTIATLRIVVPPQFPDIAQQSKQVVWNQLLTPLRTETIDELRWYFEQVGSHPTPSRSHDLDERFDEARETFAAPRFKALYRVWKQDGEPVLASAGSRAISDAVNAGAGRVEALELGHRYGHLAPLVAVA